jgi:hypothetical protein
LRDPVKKTAIVLAAIAGLGLSGASLSPAHALMAPEGAAPASVAAPPNRGQACNNYPGAVYTTTVVRLDDRRMRRGQRNKIYIKVQSAGKAEPKGNVRVTIDPLKRGRDNWRTTEHLDDGKVTVRIPRYLRVGKYAVSARYVPKKCSQWAASESNVELLTVVKGRNGGGNDDDDDDDDGGNGDDDDDDGGGDDD